LSWPCIKPSFCEDTVPIRLQTADFVIRKIADTTDGYTSLQNTHRFARDLRQNIQFAKDVLDLLQEIGADFGELAFLFGRYNRLGLIQAVGD